MSFSPEPTSFFRPRSTGEPPSSYSRLPAYRTQEINCLVRTILAMVGAVFGALVGALEGLGRAIPIVLIAAVVLFVVGAETAVIVSIAVSIFALFAAIGAIRGGLFACCAGAAHT